MTEPILTSARLAIWAAIDNYEPLFSVFKSKWRFDTDIGNAFEKIDKAGIGDMPSIGVIPIAVQAGWVLNTMMEFSDAYTVDIRAPKLKTCEDLVEKVWKAIYQAGEVVPPAASAAVSYVRAATGYYPKVIGPIQREAIQMGEGGKLRVWKFQLNVGLRLRQDPFTAT